MKYRLKERVRMAEHYFASPKSFSNEEFQAVGAVVTDCPNYSGKVPYLDEVARIREETIQECARLADKMQDAAATVLAISPDYDAGAQHDTAMEIASAIRSLSAAKEESRG
jgi:hypothetical protein